MPAGRLAGSPYDAGWDTGPVSERRDIVILGSTGSIGTQALDVVRANPDRFRVVGLTAGGSQEQLFEEQVAEFAPAFSGLGEEASTEAAGLACDVVLNGITGAVGLRPTVAALEAGQHAGAGQQGVADHRRPGRHRAGRSPARSSRSTASTARWRSACAAAAPRRCAGWC